LQEGEEVYLVIKPEAVRIGKDSYGFKGKILTNFFLGSTMEYEIEFENTLVKAICPNPSGTNVSLPPGKETFISFQKEYFYILKREREKHLQIASEFIYRERSISPVKIAG